MNNVAEIQGWIFKVRGTTNPALQFCYVKWEQSTAYHNAKYEVENQFPHGAKTINQKLFHSLDNMNPLIIFADPQFIRAIRYTVATNDAIPFVQQFNNEPVVGIDIDQLVDLDKLLEILLANKSIGDF